MYCRGMEPGDALRMGVFLHGLAGDIAAEVDGPDGLVAGDILDALPAALTALIEDTEDLYTSYYQKIFLI